MRRVLATSLLLVAPLTALSSLGLLTSLALVAGCSPAPAPANVAGYAPLSTTNVDALPMAGLPPPPPPRDDGRLPALATPERYALSLTVDPTKERFSGIATILVLLPAATPYIVMSARDLHIASAVARIGTREINATATARPGHGSKKPDELVLAFPEALPAGSATLEIRYDAPFGKDLAGLYRAEEGGIEYAFTHFEPMDARRAFPCFDEPSFKTAFDISILVPQGLVAVSNAPEASRIDGGGWTTFQFKTTRPLPTYLVAFAVGDLDIKAGATSPVPIRVVTTKGRAAEGALALDAAATLVTRLGDYFGIRYPYDKLDVVAVPDFGAGAMENAGLITFREELLLVDPAHAPTSARRNVISVMAHELAHQWFGDLVTLSWWNDTWLNEGFATWATAKIVDQWQPAFGARLDVVSRMEGVMDLDALQSARRVREPVTSPGEAIEAFDGISYQKGADVLWMIEHWIGEDTFQKGVRDYLHAKAWQSATADDLLRALDVASSKDVSKMASTFLDQTGVPSVQASFVCPSVGPATATFGESPWVPLGEPSAATSKAWTVPLCADVEGRKTCATVASGPSSYASFGKCPAWVYPNADVAGYFRVAMAEKDFLAIAQRRAKLPTTEQVGLLGDLWAAARSGAIAPTVVLAALPMFDDATDHYVTEKVSAILTAMNVSLVAYASRPAFRAYVAQRFLPRKAALGGFQAAPGESEDRKLARRATLFALGVLAEDDATLREADTLAKKWLADPTSVTGDTASVAVEIASRRAGPDRLPLLEAAVARAKTPYERVIAMRAMGELPAAGSLGDALDYSLTPAVRLSEFARIYNTALDEPSSRKLVVDWTRAHWTELQGKLSGRSLARMAGILRGACTAAERDDLAQYLGTQLASVEGARRALALGAEQAGLCIALRGAGSAAVSSYLKH